MNLGQVIIEKKAKILDNWIEAVNQDEEIPSSSQLTYQAIKDNVPKIIDSLARLLSSEHPSEIELHDFDHGIHRAQQGFEVEEMIREYRLLRQIIYSELEQIILELPPTEILNTIKLVNKIIDKIISTCVKNYVEEKLDHLHQLYNHLILTNTELMRLVEMHQDSLSYLGHELKNPLASIIGYSDLFLRLQKNQLEEPSTEDIKYIEQVLQQGKKLLRIINDSLELSLSHQDNLKLNIESISVCDLIKNIVEMLQSSAQSKQIELKYACHLADLNIKTDSLRLQQILTNLITNAIRYTDSGSVEVTCQPTDSQYIEIKVCDTGRGIAVEDQAKIFQPYFRVANSFNYHPDSRGLGLAIVAQFIKRLQGEIKLSSQLGYGSTFTVILPQTFKV